MGTQPLLQSIPTSIQYGHNSNHKEEAVMSRSRAWAWAWA